MAIRRNTELHARLTARPGSAAAAGGESKVDGRVFAPPGLSVPSPLLLLLHGAGQQPERLLSSFTGPAERLGFVVLAPKSRGVTWDLIEDRAFGTDVQAIDAALKQMFSAYAVDPRRVAIGGFSDGASYALSLGLQNGDLFHDILAFSPGFMAAPETRGRPRVFVSHGRDDRILPIDRCGRAIARDLMHAGYDVDYREFGGGHVLTPELRDAGLARFVG
jgi:phospholipase/carboxylesterase